MDWIESLFHVFPDGGTGATETAIFGALSAALAVALAVRARAAWRRTSNKTSGRR